MDGLTLVVILAPLLVGAATLVQRRRGPASGGRLVGLPLTSAPLLLATVLQVGVLGAALAARSEVAGLPASVVFCLVYARGARRTGPTRSLAIAVAAYAVVAAGLALAHPSLAAGLALTAGSVLAAYRCWPGALTAEPLPLPASAASAGTASAGTTPATSTGLAVRMLATAAFVAVMTVLAGYLGSGLAGIFFPFPAAATVMALSTHQGAGSSSVAALLGGVVSGTVSVAALCATLALVLPTGHVGLAFAAAGAAAVVPVLVTRAPARRRTRTA
jgi:hypothetical protein